MSAPTPRQRALLVFIDRYCGSQGHSPTLHEMAEALTVSRTRAVQLVGELDEKKLIDRAGGKPRTVRLTAAGAAALKAKAA